jgi:salicylate 5-hydroxylase small subunit
MASDLNFEDWLALTQLYADYASAVDSGHWDLWPEFFTDDCVYRLQPRENHERGFPLATLAFTSKGMLKDRVYGIRETLFHDPYYQRHVVGTPVVRRRGRGGFAAKRTMRCSAPSCRMRRPCSMSAAIWTPWCARRPA